MYFNLGTSENNRFVNIVRILFGLLCNAIAVFWLIFNPDSAKTNVTIWITIIFLSGFGLYQIWSGLGKAKQYIDIGDERILLRRNPVLPVTELPAAEIRKIEFFPLSVTFFLDRQKKILLRLGTIHYETNAKIFESIINFADTNQIPFEIIEEEL